MATPASPQRPGGQGAQGNAGGGQPAPAPWLIVGIAADRVERGAQLAHQLSTGAPIWGPLAGLKAIDMPQWEPAQALHASPRCKMLVHEQSRTLYLVCEMARSPQQALAALQAIVNAPTSEKAPRWPLLPSLLPTQAVAEEAGSPEPGVLMQALQRQHHCQALAALAMLFHACHTVLVLEAPATANNAAWELDVAWLHKLRVLQQAKAIACRELQAGPEAAAAALAGLDPGAQQLLVFWLGRRHAPTLHFVAEAGSFVDPSQPHHHQQLQLQQTAVRAAFKRCRPIAGSEPWALAEVKPNSLLIGISAMQLSQTDVMSVVRSALGLQALAGAAGGADDRWTGDGAAMCGGREALRAACEAARQQHCVPGAPSIGPAGLAAAWANVGAALSAAVTVALAEEALRPLPSPSTHGSSGSEHGPAASTIAPAGKGHARQGGRMGDRQGASTTPSTPAAAATHPPTDPIASPVSAAGVPPGLISAARCLASGSAVVTQLSGAISEDAVASALKLYTSTCPSLYPRKVHEAVLARALRHLNASVLGAGAPAAARKLRAACEREWREHRCQCSAHSVTGRPCTARVHDAAAQQHTPSISFLRTSLSGCAQALRPDPFNLQEANNDPNLDDVNGPGPGAGKARSAAAGASAASAATPSAQQTRGSGVKALLAAVEADLPPVDAGDTSAGRVTRYAVVAMAEFPAASSAGGAAATSSSSAGLSSSSTSSKADVRAARLGPWITVMRVGPASDYSERRGLSAMPGLVANHLYGLSISPGGEQAPAKGRAAGSRQHPRSAATVLTGAESTAALGDGSQFPTLAEAMAARQQQAAAEAAAAAAASSSSASSSSQQPRSEREQLLAVWPARAPVLPALAPASSTPSPPSTAPGSAGGAAAAAGASDKSGAGGAPAGKGKRAGAPSAAASGASASAGHAVGAHKAYVAYEFESLDGRRFLATPQQLGLSAAAAAGSSGDTARPLLSSDVPLFIDLGAHPRDKGNEESSAQWDAATRRPRCLAQLQRIHIVTPATTHPFASQPVIVFRPATQGANASASTNASASASGKVHDVAGSATYGAAAAAAASSTAAKRIVLTTAEPMLLPPASQLIITLPWAYGIPSSWVAGAGDGAAPIDAVPPSSQTPGAVGVGAPSLVPLVQVAEQAPFVVHLAAGSAMFVS